MTDTERILRLCNEIEMIMCEIYNTGHTMQNCDYEAVDKRLKAIAAEITAPPKSNGDRIRQMTDDEELLSKIGTECYRCVYNNGECCIGDCIAGNLEWLKQEVSEDGR